MKKNIKFLILLLAMTWLNSHGQVDTNSVKKELIRSDVNIRSGNTRDVLTNFFQLALNDLTGPDKRFRLSTNLFALRLKTNPKLNIDSFYKRNTFWRNSNLDFDVKLDSNYKFNGAAFGYRYAIVNKRDFTLAKDFERLIWTALEDHRKIADTINGLIAKTFSGNPNLLIRFNDELNEYTAQGSNKRFGELSDTLKRIIKTALPDRTFDEDWRFARSAKEIYVNVKDRYKNKFLWVASLNASTYSDGFLFSNIDLSTQATSGISNPDARNNVEFDINAKLSFLDDTIKTGRKLNRQMLSAEGGLNWVFRDRNTDKSILELKGSFEYNYILNGVYANEERRLFTLNATLRFRVTDEIWIPFEIKYDPEDSNVFGFLSIKSNFDWLKGLRN